MLDFLTQACHKRWRRNSAVSSYGQQRCWVASFMEPSLRQLLLLGRAGKLNTTRECSTLYKTMIKKMCRSAQILVSQCLSLKAGGSQTVYEDVFVYCYSTMVCNFLWKEGRPKDLKPILLTCLYTVHHTPQKSPKYWSLQVSALYWLWVTLRGKSTDLSVSQKRDLQTHTHHDGCLQACVQCLLICSFERMRDVSASPGCNHFPPVWVSSRAFALEPEL